MTTATQQDPTPASRPVGSFTGRKRRTTRKSVKVIDKIAKYVIITGGLGVVLAFAVIVIFIASVSVPLFAPAKVAKVTSVVLPAGKQTVPDAPGVTAAPVVTGAPIVSGAPVGPGAPVVPLAPVLTNAATQPVNQAPRALAMGIDENLASSWVLYSDGVLNSYRIASGEVVRSDMVTDRPITASTENQGAVIIGHADGTVRFGRIGQDLKFLEPTDLGDAADTLLPGQTMAYQGGVAMLTGAKQVRVTQTTLDLSDPLDMGPAPASPIRFADYLYTDRLEVIVAMREDGRLFFGSVSKRRNVLTGKTTTTIDTNELPVATDRAGQEPAALLVGVNGRLVFVVYRDGKLIRYNTDDPTKAFVAEQVDLISEPGVTISAVRMLLGNLTLIVADSKGGVNGWFPAPAPDTTATKDGTRMMKAHVMEPQASPVTAIGTSARDRQFVTADATDTVYLRHMTSGVTQAKITLKDKSPIQLVSIAPKNDGIVAFDENRNLTLMSMHNPHPDGSLRQMFLPIHYEGYAGPEHVYQSSAGTDDAELKMGLTPLVFGTIKATFYAMLIAVPIAVLAAIYSSEFMQPQVRNVVKPLVEMMASLPSVVLGFIGALIFAPFAEANILSLLALFIGIPMGVTAFGFIWQLLPPSLTRPAPGFVKFGLILVMVLVMSGLSFQIGPIIERLLFSGDFKGWLGGRHGTGTPGWLLLLTPLIFVFITIVFNIYLKPMMGLYQNTSDRMKLGLIDVGRVVVLIGVSVVVALMIGLILTAVGFDPRGPIVGPYMQRNSLIVGVVMGFAIIPIIYTVSEDALSAVPNTLRSAALGAGATPWQTAIRVVLPVATSGIFSACMIGFGRAAGETMIVLMASGRTPIIDMNIFVGLSALSANIATELPEAPVNSTHYRMLFFSAMVLFVLTFVVNTTAEIVRQRFRKRAFQL